MHILNSADFVARQARAYCRVISIKSHSEAFAVIRSLLFVLGSELWPRRLPPPRPPARSAARWCCWNESPCPLALSFMVDLVRCRRRPRPLKAGPKFGDTQSPFAFALDAPTDRALILRAGLRAPGGQFWLTEPYALNPGTDDITLPPLRAIANTAHGLCQPARLRRAICGNRLSAGRIALALQRAGG